MSTQQTFVILVVLFRCLSRESTSFGDGFTLARLSTLVVGLCVYEGHRAGGVGSSCSFIRSHGTVPVPS